MSKLCSETTRLVLLCDNLSFEHQDVICYDLYEYGPRKILVYLFVWFYKNIDSFLSLRFRGKFLNIVKCKRRRKTNCKIIKSFPPTALSQCIALNPSTCEKSLSHQENWNLAIQSTPDNSNLQGKLKKVRVIKSSQKVTESKEISKWMGRECKYHALFTTRAARVVD